MAEKQNVFKSEGKGVKLFALAFAVMMAAVTIAAVDTDSFYSVGESNGDVIDIVGDAYYNPVPGATWTRDGSEVGTLTLDNCQNLEKISVKNVAGINLVLNGSNTVTMDGKNDTNAVYFETGGNVNISGSGSLTVILTNCESVVCISMSGSPEFSAIENDYAFTIKNTTLSFVVEESCNRCDGLTVEDLDLFIEGSKITSKEDLISVIVTYCAMDIKNSELNFSSTTPGSTALMADEGIHIDNAPSGDIHCFNDEEEECDWTNDGTVLAIGFDSSFKVGVSANDNLSIYIGIAILVIIVVAVGIYMAFKS